jgi:hypothetical protein
MFAQLQALNSFAVEHIVDGEYKEAAEALDCLRLELSKCSILPTPIGATGLPSSETEVLTELCYDYRNRFKNQPDDDFFVLPASLEFPSDLLESEELHMTSQMYCLCTITSLYNIGLCYHLEWSKTKSRSLLLRRALTCYERASSLSSGCPISSENTILQIIMAVCHNAVHCSRELLADLEMAKLWNDRLFQVLKYARQAKQIDCIECDYDEFIVYAYFARQELSRPTGAAAA